VPDDQRKGDFQPSCLPGSFWYDIEQEFFEVVRLLRKQNKIPPRLLADIIQDLFSDDEDHAKKSALKWEEMKYYARKFVHITDVVKDENVNEVFDVESTFPTRYPKGSWIPLLQNAKNVTMTGIIPPNHRKSEALWRWEDDEYANAGYGLRSVCTFSFVWYSG